MKSHTIQKLEHSKLKTTAASDEICIIFSSRCALGPFAKDLIKQSYVPLERKNHYAKAHFGFFDQKSKPWLLIEFTSNGINALEERWVLHDLMKSLQSSTACRKVLFYFESGCTGKDLILAEDIITTFSTALYDGSKWTSIRLFAEDPQGLTQKDTEYSTRFARQLEYRRWVNENPDSLTSLEIGARLSDFAKKHSCSMVTLDESRLKDERMNLLLSVGQAGKKSPSRLHILGHNLDQDKPPIALIGKGITFDSGGINLKPHESFVNCMKNDMGGAALFSQLFMGLVETGYKGPLLLLIPCCENAIDADSMKPGSVIKSRSGKSILIEHTDAEGRLILADAMSYAWDHYNPTHVYTAATLTTASLRQFSNYFTAVHFAEPSFKDTAARFAEMTGEQFTFWGTFLPFLNGNRTNAADLTNMGRLASHASMGGGSNVAAHFLREFAQGPYTHFDVFNSIWNWSGDYPGAHYGCTGAVFNTLWHTFRQES